MRLRVFLTLLVLCAGSLWAQEEYIRLFSFRGTNGAQPHAALIEGPDGRLYGTTAEGGFATTACTNGAGTIFTVRKDGTDYKVLHYFQEDPNDGANPYCSLAEGAFGELYGTTRNGGLGNNGTIFNINKDGTGYSVIKQFSGQPPDGTHPKAGLIVAPPDEYRASLWLRQRRRTRYRPIEIPWLRGATMSGGNDGAGTVFKIKEDGTSYETVLSIRKPNDFIILTGSWTLADGYISSTDIPNSSSSAPELARVQPDRPASSRSARGSTPIRLRPGAGFIPVDDFNLKWAYEIAYGGPFAGLTFADGSVYGVGRPGAHDAGTILILFPGVGFAPIKVFTGVDGDGAYPIPGLLPGSDGWLYGVTSAGGEFGYGTIFALRIAQ